MRNVPISAPAELAARCRDYPSSSASVDEGAAMAAEPKWQQDSSDHADEWTDEDEMEWQEANASRFAPDDRQLGQILGLFSIGLGLAEVLAPRALGRAIGVGDHPAIMRMV